MGKTKKDKSTKELFDEIKSYKLKRLITGCSLIFVGILGLILPIMPGWALIFLGLVLLFPRWGKKMVKKILTFLRMDSNHVDI